MGSFLRGYLRQRDLRNFQRAQEFNIASQIAAVDEQIEVLLEDGSCLRGELAQSVYLHHYLIGVLDSITSFYERETRKRLGLELFRDAFVRYFRIRFLIPRFEAERLFLSANDALHSQSASVGMHDGYQDGLLVLGGKMRPRGLLNRFSKRPANDVDIGVIVDFPALAAATA